MDRPTPVEFYSEPGCAHAGVVAGRILDVARRERGRTGELWSGLERGRTGELWSGLERGRTGELRSG